MNIAEYVKNQGHGAISALARRIEAHSPDVSDWVHGHRIVPIRYCTAIVGATNGAVMNWDLRPADWHLIWPELIERPDAPPLPSPLPDLAQFAPRKRGRKPTHARARVWSPQTPAEKLAAAGIEHQGGG